MGRESAPSSEEMWTKLERNWIISDVDLMMEGASIKSGGRLEITDKQHNSARVEMEFAKEREFGEKVPQAQAALAEFESRVREYWQQEKNVDGIEKLTEIISQSADKLRQLMQEVTQLDHDSSNASRASKDDLSFQELQRQYALLKKIYINSTVVRSVILNPLPFKRGWFLVCMQSYL